MGKAKSLRVAHAPEASLLSLVITGGPMTLLNEIVLTLGSRNRYVLSRSQLRHCPDRRAIASEPVADDPLGYVLGVDQPSEEALGCAGITVFLQQHIQHLTVLVDGAPEPVDPSSYHHPHFVQMPRSASPRFTVTQCVCYIEVKLGTPSPDRLVTDVNTPLEQQLLHIPIEKQKAMIEVNRVGDDRSWKAIALRIFGRMGIS